MWFIFAGLLLYKNILGFKKKIVAATHRSSGWHSQADIYDFVLQILPQFVNMIQCKWPFMRPKLLFAGLEWICLNLIFLTFKIIMKQILKEFINR